MDYEEREFQRVVSEGLVPQMEGASICVSLCPSSEDIDAKFCVELGAMIMLDKPIITIVPPGRSIPPKLEMISDKIVHADIATPEGSALIQEAVEDMQREMGGWSE